MNASPRHMRTQNMETHGAVVVVAGSLAVELAGAEVDVLFLILTVKKKGQFLPPLASAVA
jgi:hypothetical protein